MFGIDRHTEVVSRVFTYRSHGTDCSSETFHDVSYGQYWFRFESHVRRQVFCPLSYRRVPIPVVSGREGQNISDTVILYLFVHSAAHSTLDHGFHLGSSP